MKDRIPILSIESLPPDVEVMGVVSASICFSKSMLGDVVANVKNWTIGGELSAYSQLLDKAMDTVVDRLSEKAVAQGATSVIGFRICTSQVAEGAAELIAYGTAIRAR